MFSGIQKHHGGTTMTELDKAANEYANSIAQHDHNKIFSIYDFKAGANWRYEQFEKNRLAACDNMTKEEAEREQEFTIDFIEKNNRIPTYSDAIEYGRESMRERLTKLKKLADNMYNAAQYLTTDASRLHKAMEEYRQYVINELKEE